MQHLKTLAILLIGQVLTGSSMNHGNRGYLTPKKAHQNVQRLTALTQLLENQPLDNLLLGRIGSLDPMEIFTIFHSQNRSSLNVSELCTNQTMHLMNNPRSRSNWAMKMLDAWAKPESGVLGGNLVWLGAYDQCISVESEYNQTWQPSSLHFKGKYCSPYLEEHVKDQKLIISFGVCIPDGCTIDDVTTIINSAMNISGLPDVKMYNCQGEMRFSSGAIATIVLFGILSTICLTSTIYDYTDQWLVRYQASSSQTVEDDDVPILNDGTLGPPARPTSPQRKPTAPSEKGTLHKLLLCFSFYTNGSKLLSTKQPDDALHCVHGIRFISMTWVILGHTLVFNQAYCENVPAVFGWISRWTFQAILNAPVSVDSFFVLSSLLLTYLFLKSFDKSHVPVKSFLKSVPVMYLHRYLRLTPALGLMMLLYIYLSSYLAQGPLASTHTITDDNCKDHWWTNLFYINNLYSEECAGWTWYLANDFQFFLVAPFIVYLIYRYAIVGLPLAIVMVITSCGAATGISIHEKAGLNAAGDDHGWFSNMYVAPWTRYQAYGVGILFGYAVWRCNGSLKISWWLNVLMWIVSAVLCATPLYGPHDAQAGGHKPTTAESAVYNGWSRTSWSVGLGWVILACCTENGGWVNEFLSWKGFIPLSRMTYAAYLIHPLVINITTQSRRSLIIFNDLTYIETFLVYLVMSYAVAFMFSLLCEAPFMNLDKHFLSGQLNAKKK